MDVLSQVQPPIPNKPVKRAKLKGEGKAEKGDLFNVGRET